MTGIAHRNASSFKLRCPRAPMIIMSFLLEWANSIPYVTQPQLCLYLARLSGPGRTQAPAGSLRFPFLSLNIHESAIVLVTILTKQAIFLSHLTHLVGPSSPNSQLVPNNASKAYEKQPRTTFLFIPSQSRSPASGLPISQLQGD